MRYYLVSLHTGKRCSGGYFLSKAKADAACKALNRRVKYFRVEKG